MQDDGAPGRLAALVAPFADNLRNPDLRRAQLSFAAAWSAEWAFTVGLSVYAFRQGGATAVGLIAAVRLLPSAFAAPLLLPLVDRVPRSSLLAAISGTRAAMTAVAALVVAGGGPEWAVYVAAVASTVAGTLFRPVHSAFLPSLCQLPHELAGANAVRGLLDSVSILVGPAAAALLLHWYGPAAVFVAAATAAAVSGLLMLRVHPPQRARDARTGGASAASEFLSGVRLVLADRDLLVLISLATAQTFVRGALTVFSVVVSVQILGAGASGVGVLTAAVGAGAIVGSVAVARLVRTRSLARWFGTGVAMWGLPLVMVAATSALPATCLLLGVIGVGNALVDVGLFTLLARLSDDDTSARVFGVLEGVVALGVAAGGLVAPVLITGFGVRPALVIVGLLTPTLVALAWLRLRAIDGSLVIRSDAIDLLRGVGMLRPLSLPLIEELARRLVPAEAAAGAVVIAQGDTADRFYVIREGTADVIGDQKVIRTLAAGDGFGEIALLRDVPRTASVRATSALQLETLSRDSFLRIVTGYPPSAEQAAAEVDAKLGRFAPKQRKSR